MDNAFLKFESLPFDEARSLVWRDRPTFKKRELISEWCIFAIIGIVVGSVAFLMLEIEDHLVIEVRSLTNDLIYERGL